jgi:hypothetical protein
MKALQVTVCFGFFSATFLSPFGKVWLKKRFRIDPFADKDQLRESKFFYRGLVWFVCLFLDSQIRKLKNQPCVPIYIYEIDINFSCEDVVAILFQCLILPPEFGWWLSIVSTSPLFSKVFRHLSRRSSPWNSVWNF